MPMTFSADQALLLDAPFAVPPGLLDPDSQLTLASAIAERAVVSDIESECIKVQLDDVVWWDTRPMTDPREHSPDTVEMATQAIRYAIGTGLARIHTGRPYLLTFEGI